jgi:hypothetical protein
MPYGFKEWTQRIAERSDFTIHLTHLTRANGDLKAIDVLFKILTEKRLNGSSTASGFIVGNRSAVCLQEAPIYSIAQNVYTEEKYRESNPQAKRRYTGMGLQFNKESIYKRGGRPVIYEATKYAKSILPEKEWWRIVNLDLSKRDTMIDWSHEREWRVPDNLDFELNDVTVLLPSRKMYKAFISRAIDDGNVDLLKEVRGIIELQSVFF